MSRQLSSGSVSFDQDLCAHPWWVLVKNICDEVPLREMKNLIFNSEGHLGSSFKEIYDQCNGLKFFHVLEERLGLDKVAVYVENLLSHDGIHDGTGHKLSIWVQDYRRQLEDYRKCCLQNGVPRDPKFVGRQEDVKRILDILRDSNNRGVFIHGCQGMGKTTLAEEVCYNLTVVDRRYSVLVLDLRGRNTLSDLLHEFLAQLDVASFDKSAAVLKQQVYKAVRENRSLFKRNTVLLWDSVEDILENDQDDFMDFMQQLLNTMADMHADCKARLLLTCCNELPRPLPSLDSIGLKPLSQEDSKDLLTKLAYTAVRDDLLSSVSDYCGGCPLALHIASCSIHNSTLGNMQQPPEIKHTEFLNHLLSKIFHDLDQTSQEMLVKLSIFETSLFDFTAAIKILEMEKDKIKVKEFLQRMNDKHLIEVKDKSFIRGAKYSPGTRSRAMSSRGSLDRSFESTRSLSLSFSRGSLESSVDSSFDSPSDDDVDFYGEHEYSFHRHISSFLKTEQNKTQFLRDSLQNAKDQFLKHFISVLSNCGNTKDADPLKCLQLLAKHKIHVRIFYKLLDEEKKSVSELLFDKRAKSRQQHLSNISCLSGLVLNVDDRRQYFRREAAKSMDKDVCQYIQWKCEEVEAYLEEGKCDEAEKIIHDLSDNHLHKIRTVEADTSCNDNLGYKVHVVAWFHYVKGRYYFHDHGQKSVDKEWYENALSELQIAIYLYKGNFDYYKDWFDQNLAKSMRSFTTSHAGVLNMMGRVWFVKGDLEQSVEDRKKTFEKAQKYHEEALEMILREKKNKNHFDIPVYQTNIGACIHKLLLIADKDKKKELCKEALSWYDASKKTSVKLHENFNIGYADTLRNRSDIYRLKSKLDGEDKLDCLKKAVKDAEESLQIKEILLTPQDINLIRSAYDLADVRRLLAIECGKVSPYCIIDHYNMTLESYEKVLQLIQAGGFPWVDGKDNLYKRIKAGHKYVLEKLQCPLKMEKARKAYEEIESRLNPICEQKMDLPANPISRHACQMNDPMEMQDDERFLSSSSSLVSFISHDTAIQQGLELREQKSGVKEENMNLQTSQDSLQDLEVRCEKERSFQVSESEGYLYVEMKPQLRSEVKGEEERQCLSFEMSSKEDEEVTAYESRSLLPITNTAADISAEPVCRTGVHKRRPLKRQKPLEVENSDFEINDKNPMSDQETGSKEKIGLRRNFGDTRSLSSDQGNFRTDSGVDLCSSTGVSMESHSSSSDVFRKDSSLQSSFSDDEIFKTPLENMAVGEENSVKIFRFKVDSGVESDAVLIQSSGSSDGSQLADKVKTSRLTSLEEESMLIDN